MSPNITNLSRYLIYGRSAPPKLLQLDCKNSTCLAIVAYVMQFCSNQEHAELTSIIKHLDDLAKEILSRQGELQSNILEGKFAKMVVEHFIPEVQRFFEVPKLYELSDNERHLQPVEILAGFLNFLIQLLNSEELGKPSGGKWYSPYYSWRLRDEQPTTSWNEHQYGLLRQKLRFLLSVLGDKPFQCGGSGTHHRHDLLERVSILLAQFEMLANEAGNFIYSRLLSVRSVKATNHAETVALLEKLDLLNANIKEYSIEFSDLPNHLSLRYHVTDSFFIFDSLIEDLDNMMSQQMDSSLEHEIKVLHYELRSLHITLKIKDVGDADHLKDPLIQLRDLAYEAEYLINSYVAANIPFWYLNLRFPGIVQKFKLTREGLQHMKEMCISDNIKRFDTSKVSSQPAVGKATLAMDDCNLSLGFHDNMTRILADIVGNPKSARRVISIYGMPGIGKTTMARELYSCNSATTYFYRRAWCVISQTYNMQDSLIGLLLSLQHGSNQEDFMHRSVDDLGVGIHKILKGQRYLIILDDIWKSDVWYGLQRYFPDDGNGSRIILTSRIKDVAPSYSVFHTLPLLPVDHCWDLISRKLFSKDSCPQQLLSVGKEIASKCCGIPLAVVSTAGLLANVEKETSAWERVEKQLDALLSDNQSDYRKIFEISYKHLPHNVKACFLYLAAFPEDTEIYVKYLLQLWIAQGFIPKEEERCPEEIAGLYLADLINRSLVMTAKRRYDGGTETCIVHDLIHDICIKKANEENFFKSTNDDFSIYDKYQHVRGCTMSYNYLRPFGLHCRSFIGYPSSSSVGFREMALLRVAEMYRPLEYPYVPARLDLPVNLRYLHANLCPATLHNLVRLEFLHIDEGLYTISIPLSVIIKLVKLRHMLITSGVAFEYDCDISETTNLRSLSFVKIGEINDDKILEYSPHLWELKCYVMGKKDFPDLHCLAKLELLTMDFIYSRIEQTFPVSIFPSALKELCFKKSKLPWEMMSVIGTLPNLEVLILVSNAFVGEVWETNEGEFENLRYLAVQCDSLKDWRSCPEHFPVLKFLEFNDCTELLSIPTDMGNISTLQTIKMWNCSKEACLSAVQIEEEQHHDYENLELQVIVTGNRWTKEELIKEFVEHQN